MVSSSIAPHSLGLSKDQTLNLLTELLAGFDSDDFQRQLNELAKQHGAKQGKDFCFIEGRQVLTLAVQRRVLPCYGFAGDEDGVLAMKAAVRKHMGDPRVAQKSLDIRHKLLIPEVCPKASTVPAAAPYPAWDLSGPLGASRSCPDLPAPAPAPGPAPGPVPAPAPAPASSLAAAAQAESHVAIKKNDAAATLIVQHMHGQGELVLGVRRREEGGEGTTMLQVKEAIVQALGRGTVEDVQLKMWGGGMFVNHLDSDDVCVDRVFATGLDLRVIT